MKTFLMRYCRLEERQENVDLGDIRWDNYK